MAVQSIDELMERILAIKANYATGQIKLNVQGLYTMVMAGAMDCLIGKSLTVKERQELNVRIQTTLKSETEPQTGKKGELGLADIRSEIDRYVWLAQRNPFYCFRFSDQYTHALTALGYMQTGKPNMVARNITGDIFSNWSGMSSATALKYYCNPNVQKQVGIVAQFQGLETIKYTNGEFLRVTLFDGSRLFSGAVWPEFNKKTYPPKLIAFLKNQKRKTGIFTGRLKESKGFVNFTIYDIFELG